MNEELVHVCVCMCVCRINNTHIHTGEKCLGNDSTYTVCVSSCGRSACSGKTGCGGSPMGTQPRDLLMAWLSFLAGDFCEGEQGGIKVVSP